MRTIYIIKSPSNNISFGSNSDLGLHFVESSVDIRFLDNVVLDGKLKILVNQRCSDQSIGQAAIWFVLFDDQPLTNKSLELAYIAIKNIGNQLFRITRLGQKFSYKDIYTIPNVSDSWNIEDTYLNYHDNGGFKEIYCLDRTKPIGTEGDETTYHATGKTVKADLVVVVGSESQRTQAQFVHITMPSTNIKIDASGLRTPGDISLLQNFHSIDGYRTATGLIFEIYNTAITSEGIFTSYLLLYQIVEIVISERTASPLDEEAVVQVLGVVRDTSLLDAALMARLQGLLKGLRKETSVELLASGLTKLLGDNIPVDLDYSKLASWRRFRGKITHPMRTQELTDTEFNIQYESLRKFADTLACALQ